MYNQYDYSDQKLVNDLIADWERVALNNWGGYSHKHMDAVAKDLEDIIRKPMKYHWKLIRDTLMATQQWAQMKELIRGLANFAMWLKNNPDDANAAKLKKMILSGIQSQPMEILGIHSRSYCTNDMCQQAYELWNAIYS